MQPIHRLLLIGLASCMAATPTDGADDSFLGDGKADAVISEGTPEADGVLAVVNALSQDELDDAVGLDARAAAGIVAHRSGADAQGGTSDDDPFDTLAELDAVPYVGRVALDKLLTYANANGYIGGGREYEAVFSISPSDAWAVGKNGVVDHWDGSTWTALDSGSSAWLTAVWASGPNDVWISGYAAALLHWDGSALKPIDAPISPNVDLVAISGSSPDNVWFVGGAGQWGKTILVWNGSQFGTLSCTQCQVQPSSVHVVSKTDAWVGGLQESAYHYDGTRFWDESIYLTTYPSGVGKIWAAPSGTVYAEVDGDIYKRPAGGTAWSKMYGVPAHDSSESWLDLRSFVAFSENDIWASGGEGHVAHWDGTSWELTHVDGKRDYYDIAGTSSHDLWAVGPGGRAHFDGTSWTESFPSP